MKIEFNYIANDLVNHAYLMKPNKNSRGLDELPGW